MADLKTVDGAFLASLCGPILTVAGATVRAWTFIAGLPFLRSGLRSGASVIVAIGLAFAVASQPTWHVDPHSALIASSGIVSSEIVSSGNASAGCVLILVSLCSEAILGWLISLPFALALHRLPLLLRITDLLRGAQEAEQAIPGLEGRTSLLERVGWIGAGVAIFSSGLFLPVLSTWFHSFDRLHPLFLLSDSVVDPNLPGRLDVFFSRLSMLALETVLSAISTVFPLVVASVAIDLVRICAARMINAQELAAEWQGFKLVALLLLAALLINSRLSELTSFTIRSATAAAEQLLPRG